MWPFALPPAQPRANLGLAEAASPVLAPGHSAGFTRWWFAERSGSTIPRKHGPRLLEVARHAVGLAFS